MLSINLMRAIKLRNIIKGKLFQVFYDVHHVWCFFIKIASLVYLMRIMNHIILQDQDYITPSDHTLDVREGSSPGPLVHAPLRPETVEEVLGEVSDSAGKDGTRRRFLVRWTGRPATDDSWISEEELRRYRPEHFDAEMDTGGPQLVGAELSPPREDDGDHLSQTTRRQPARRARADVRDPTFVYTP